jgi:hypothetical protein
VGGEGHRLLNDARAKRLKPAEYDAWYDTPRRRRFVPGLLHRHSLLWREKGRGDSGSSYAGAHWHTRAEVEAVLQSLPVRDARFGYAVFDPAASILARVLERIVPSRIPLGSFLAVTADVNES